MGIGKITSLGTGSGLNLQSMLDTQRKADMDILNLKKKNIKSQNSIKTQLNSVLNQLLSMKTSALVLSLASNYGTRSATASNQRVVFASALDGTQTGTHSVKVLRLASASSYISQGMSSDSATVYPPRIQESIQGFESGKTALAKGETLTIKYGASDGASAITIKASTGEMTTSQLVKAINSDAANQDGNGNALVKATVYQDKDGKSRLRIASASGESTGDNRIEVTESGTGLGFTAPESVFSLKLGKEGTLFSLSVPADTSLKELAQMINKDEKNPGVTASVINTGNGDMPYKLVLASKSTGEDTRISIVGEPSGLSLSEKNGKGFTMRADRSISFDTAITITADNDQIIFKENAGWGYSQDLTAKIRQGRYNNAEDLARAVENALETASALKGSTKDYQVAIDPDTGKMALNETGTLKGLSIKWGDKDSTAASVLGFSKNSTLTPAATSLNALATVNGVSYQRQSNLDQTDIVQGLTLSFHATGSSTVSVASDTDAIKKEISSLVNTYNTLYKEIDENDDYDKDNDTWGSLSQSASIRILKVALQDLFNRQAAPQRKITGFKDLGIELKRDRTLSMDTRKLDRQLKENFNDVKALFLGSDTTGQGLANTLNDTLGGYALSGGYIKGEISTIDTRVIGLETAYKNGLQRIEKKYETMTRQYAELDKYLSTVASTMSYIKKMLSSSKGDD